MIPFKVLIHLSTPMMLSSEQPRHLDSLLAWALTKELEGLGDVDPWTNGLKLDHLLQKEVNEVTGDWAWCASMLKITWASTPVFVNHIRKHEEGSYLDDLAQGFWGHTRKINDDTFKLNSASGPYRGYQWLASMRHAAFIEAHAIGDMDEIERLMRKHVKTLGEKEANGNGLVQSMAFTPDTDTHAWRERILPDGMKGKPGLDYFPVLAAVNPPYWKSPKVIAMEPVA